MPVYEYVCEKCGKTTEALRPMRDADSPIVCEHCKSKKVHRAHSVFAAAVKESAPAAGPGCASCAERGSCPMG